VITVSATTETSAYQPWWHAARVTIVGVPAEPKQLRIGQGSTRDWQYDPKSHSVAVIVPKALENWTIHLEF
jgi:hypothetical protein